MVTELEIGGIDYETHHRKTQKIKTNFQTASTSKKIEKGRR